MATTQLPRHQEYNGALVSPAQSAFTLENSMLRNASFPSATACSSSANVVLLADFEGCQTNPSPFFPGGSGFIQDSALEGGDMVADTTITTFGGPPVYFTSTGVPAEGFADPHTLRTDGCGSVDWWAYWDGSGQDSRGTYLQESHDGTFDLC